MKAVISMTAYDRPELFKQALENLTLHYPSGADRLEIFVDRAHDSPMGKTLLAIVEQVKNTADCFLDGIHVTTNEEPRGIAVATNLALFKSSRANVDVIIHIDSDCFVAKSGWAQELAQFLMATPSVGLAAPDLPGRYMRIKRVGYDEIEYALGMVWACKKDVLHALSFFLSEGVFDQNISHQFDPDMCLRLRMMGYRVGIKDIGPLVDLGVGSGDSSKSSSVWRGGFEFLRKWNQHFLGYFHYKSPASLTWDSFPPNFVWRRLWLSQFRRNEELQQDTLQGHCFDLVEFPWATGKWNLEATREHLKSDIQLCGTDQFEKVDEALLSGSRPWSINDSQQRKEPS